MDLSLYGCIEGCLNKCIFECINRWLDGGWMINGLMLD